MASAVRGDTATYCLNNVVTVCDLSSLGLVTLVYKLVALLTCCEKMPGQSHLKGDFWFVVEGVQSILARKAC